MCFKITILPNINGILVIGSVISIGHYICEFQYRLIDKISYQCITKHHIVFFECCSMVHTMDGNSKQLQSILAVYHYHNGTDPCRYLTYHNLQTTYSFLHEIITK